MSVFLSIVMGAILIVPALLIWGWIRWWKSTIPRTILSTFSFVGFCLATASALLGLFTHLYAVFIRSFPFTIRL